ncbi:hypothetical protein Goarm_023286, partial [Gossypium armourianum]|nr:hypothetical protein [Gossypium armourianum]
EPRQGVARKRSLTETGEEENGRSIDLNVELTPTGQPPKDRLSTNRSSEISSTSLSETSRMLLNQQDSSGEEVEFSNATPEEPPLVAMGCTRCLVFVLTSETNPKCVNCQTPEHLID